MVAEVGAGATEGEVVAGKVEAVADETTVVGAAGVAVAGGVVARVQRRR